MTQTFHLQPQQQPWSRLKHRSGQRIRNESQKGMAFPSPFSLQTQEPNKCRGVN